MELPVACGRCGYEWTYTGTKHPHKTPAYQVTCPDCGNPSRFEDALRIPLEEIPEREDDPFEDRITALYENTVFTRKQCEVLALREAQYSTPEIARRMDISTSMVAQHEGNIQDRIEKARKTLAFGDSSVTLQTGRGARKYVQIPFTPELAVGTP